MRVLALAIAAGASLLAAHGQTATPTVESSTTPTMPDTWVDRHKEMVAEAKANADKIQIVLLGDSITWRWTSGAGKALKAERYDPYGVINLGISADATQHVLWRLQHGVLDPLKPKMVLLMIGTNNLGSSDPEAVAYGVWSIVDQIRRTHPETRVLVQGIFPKTTPKHTEKVAPTNALLAKLDDGKMVKYIDFSSKFLKPDGTLDLENFPDGVHPEKPVAFQIWADSIQPIVDEWLKTPPIADVPPPAPPVAKPADLVPATPDFRNDWMYRFKRTAERAAKGNVDLLFLGDTSTYVWDRQEELFKAEYGAYRPMMGALWGNRTENILWQIDNGGLKGIAPKLIVLQMQENVSDNTPVAAVAAGVGEIIKRLRTNFPESKILLVGAFPLGKTASDGARAKSTEYNTTVAKLADEQHVFFLDPSPAFLSPDGTLVAAGIPSSQSKPKSEAYVLWARVQKARIAELMGAPVAP